eukprot:g1323.t1
MAARGGNGNGGGGNNPQHQGAAGGGNGGGGGKNRRQPIPAPQNAQQAAAQWQGGPQNEVKDDPAMLGTEFIEYRRSPAQYLAEQNYAATEIDFGNGKKGTSPSLRPFPLTIDGRNIDGHKASLHKQAAIFVDKAKQRAGKPAGKGGALATLRFVQHPMKGQNLADEMVTKGRKDPVTGKSSKVKASKIALVIAGNSGLPGGGTTGMSAKGKFRVQIPKIHNGHGTQEESVVSNWYVHQVQGYPQLLPGGRGKKFQQGMQPNHFAQKLIQLYVKTIQAKWGLKSNNAGDYATVQGLDYVHTQNPVAFADCWVVRNPRIGAEKAAPKLDNPKTRSQDWKKTWRHAAKTYPSMTNGGHQLGALLFVAAPNAACTSKHPSGSCTRTKNQYAAKNLNFFLSGLQAAVTGAIDAAIQEQLLYGKELTVLIFNKLGGGLYWPQDKNGKRIGGGASKKNYVKVIEAALDEVVEVENVNGLDERKVSLKKRAFFEDVVMTHDDNN